MDPTERSYSIRSLWKALGFLSWIGADFRVRKVGQESHQFLRATGSTRAHERPIRLLRYWHEPARKISHRCQNASVVCEFTLLIAAIWPAVTASCQPIQAIQTCKLNTLCRHWNFCSDSITTATALSYNGLVESRRWLFHGSKHSIASSIYSAGVRTAAAWTAP